MLAAQRSIDAGNTKLDGGVSKIGKSLGTTFGITGPLAIAAAGAAIGKFAFDSINAASDLNESLNKTNVVFGDSADAVRTFGEQSAESFGISNQAALEAAAGFGNILQTSGIVEQKSADMSVALVKLAADMASFNNIEPAEALEKLRSGLVGEAEPLRTVGVLLSESRVAAEAYSSGIAKQGAELTDAQKVQARYNLILADTTKQQGDFGRTSDSLANQTRSLQARFVDIEAEVGGKLLPVLTATLDVILGLPDPVIEAAGAVAVLGTGIAAVNLGLKALPASLSAVLTAFGPVVWAIGVATLTWSEFDRAMKGATKDIADADKIINVGRGGLVTLKEGVNATGEAYRGLDGAIGTVNSMLGKAETPLGNIAEAHKFAADAARDQRDAELGLAGGLLGLVGDLDDLGEAQHEVNRLKRRGKTDTDAYHEAVLGAAEAAVRFRSDITELYADQKEANATTDDGVRSLIDIGRQFGLTRRDLTDLLGPLGDYVRGLDSVPPNVHTRVTADISQAMRGIGTITAALDRIPAAALDVRLGTSVRAAQSGFHGTVSSPTLFLAAEAGPERVDIGPGGARGGGAVVNVTVNVAGSVTAEEDLVRAVRRGLDRIGRYNPNIFGGRA